MVVVSVKPLNSCNAAFLLMQSLVSGSDKSLIKGTIEVFQHEMKTLFSEFRFLFLAYHHHPILMSYRVVLFYNCRRITAKLSLCGLCFLFFLQRRG